MRNTIFISLLTLVFTGYLNAQVIANFEDGAVTVKDSGNIENVAVITNPFPGGINTSDSVLVVDRAIGSTMWEGSAEIFFNLFQNTGDHNRLFIKAYVDTTCRAFITLYDDNSIVFEGWYLEMIERNQWVKIQFDIEDYQNLDFNLLQIRFGDWDDGYDEEIDVTAYIDDIELGNEYLVPQPEICMVTVDQSINKNMVIWDVPEGSGGVDSVLIFKKIDSDIFQQVSSLPVNEQTFFVDYESNPAQKSESYCIAFKDTSGVISLYSWEHQTIHLMMSYGIGGAINLSWNYYAGFSYDAFDIYRGSSLEDLQLLSRVSNNILSFTDLTPPSGDLYYVISVTNPAGCEVPTIKKSTQAVYSSTQSNMVTNTISGHRDYLADDKITITPNPASERVRIQFAGSVDELDVEIISVDGRSQIKRRIINGSEMEVSSLNSGLYFLIIDAQNTRITKRLVIQ